MDYKNIYHFKGKTLFPLRIIIVQKNQMEKLKAKQQDVITQLLQIGWKNVRVFISLRNTCKISVFKLGI